MNNLLRSALLVAASSLASVHAAPAVAQANAPAVTTEGAQAEFEDAADALQLVSESARLLVTMQAERGLREHMQEAEGVFLIPDYARASLGIGARAGEGVLLVRRNGHWSDPAFYDIGGLSLGLQAGIETGGVAFILNNQRAVDSFLQENNWSLNADAGLTIGAWSEETQASAGRGDITVWSDNVGLSGNFAVSVTDIHFDKEETAAYYNGQVALSDILQGRVKNPHSEQLKMALADFGQDAAASSGASDPRAIAVTVPVTVLIPLEETTGDRLQNGCWVRLVSNQPVQPPQTSGGSEATGAADEGATSGGRAQEQTGTGTSNQGANDLVVAGSMSLPSLRTSAGIDWSRRTDRIEVGPSASVTVFEDAQFQGRSETLKAGQQVRDLRKELGFGQSIDSLRVDCQT